MYCEYLKSSDPEVFSFIGDELRRQRTSIELIASENLVSLAVMEMPMPVPQMSTPRSAPPAATRRPTLSPKSG